MPDLIPAPAAPAAAAPTPPTTPPPTPAPEVKPTSKELANKLFGLLTAPTADPAEPPKPAEKKEQAPPPPPPPKGDAPPAAPGERPIKRSKADAPAPTPPPEEKPPELPRKKTDATPPPAPAAPPVVAAPVKADDESFEKDLVEEERVMLDDARAAEKYLADKYKGFGPKMLTFLRENAKKAELVDKGELDQGVYEKWHADNVPKIGVLDQRKVTEERVRESVRKDYEPKIDEERHARWADAEAPKIKARGNEVYNKLSNSALPDEVMAAIAERTKGITDRTEYVKKVQEVQKEYALEFEVAEAVINQATNDIEEFHALTTTNPATGKSLRALHADAEVWDPAQARWVPNIQSTNPVARQHAGILAMVSALCTDFKATGGAALKNAQGQWFATREEYNQMKSMVEKGELAPQEFKKWWTFTNEQIVDRALGRVKDVVKQGVKSRLEYLEGRGFKRSIAAAPAAPTPPTPPQPPGAPAAPRPSLPPPSGTPPAPSMGASLAGKLTSQPAAQ